jgi:CBS domain-containing protein
MKTVRDAMTRNPVCALPSTPVSEAAAMMAREDVGSLPVTSGPRSSA